jgi:HSP20 family protein
MFYAAASLPSLRRWSAPVAANRSLERFLDQAFAATRLPGSHFTQDESSFTLNLDLPGVAKEHLSIAIEDNLVRISTKEEASRRYQAAYELPQEIDAGASSAKLENGVLTLRLAKKPATSNATELSVQ